jgi:hemoglobin-like flavoprotein
MAFNQDQIDRLSSSFALVEPRLDDVIATFYTKLFETAPSVRELFPDDMSGQKKHLGSALKLVAQNVSDIEKLADPLRQMGARHVGYGAQEAHYPVVRDTMLFALSEVAGYAWTPQLNDDWGAALNAVAGYMIEGQQQAEAKAA